MEFAFAGIADSPLPVLLTGKTTYHLYSPPGVVNDGGLSTIFSCTSTSASAMTVGVELFGAGGGSPINNAATTPLSLSAGATVTFGTSGTAGFPVNPSLAAPLNGRGSARVLSTSKQLICTALLADNISAPPTSMTSLTIVKKVTHRRASEGRGTLSCTPQALCSIAQACRVRGYPGRLGGRVIDTMTGARRCRRE